MVNSETVNRRTAWMVAVFLIAATLLGFGISRASVGTAYLDSVGKLRPQDESTFTSMALTLVNGGDWLTPRLLGRYLMYKPPLLIWLSDLSMRLLGVSLLALRLPS